MAETSRRLLQRLIRRIPTQELQPTLEKWGRLSPARLQTIDFTQSKWAFTENLATIFEENNWAVKQITELELIYVINNPNVGMWHTFQLMDPRDNAHTVEQLQFRGRFKSNLAEVIKNVSVKIKKHTDEGVWIRIAWGDALSQPNHFKPTYVVYYLQTPYVFVTGLSSKHKPLLSQALVVASSYHAIKDANLSGRKFTALRDLLMRQYEQVFPTKFQRPLKERNQAVTDPRIEREQAESSANRLQMASEAFGGGKLPQLQSAVYKLETKFRGHNRSMTQREEPVRCVVKFASTNILESFRNCASSGIASTPVNPLLSSIPLKGKNYFVITDNRPEPSRTRTGL